MGKPFLSGVGCALGANNEVFLSVSLRDKVVASPPFFAVTHIARKCTNHWANSQNHWALLDHLEIYRKKSLL